MTEDCLLLAEFHVSAVTLRSSTPVRIDAGEVLLGKGESEARRLLERLAGVPTPRDEDSLALGVPGWAMRLVHEEKVDLPALQEEARGFVEAIGGIEGFPQWHGLASEKANLDRRFVWKAQTLAQVSSASFTPYKDGASETFCDLHGDSYGDAEAILRVQDYSLAGAPGPEAPPFAWATTALAWEGVTPDMIAETIAGLEDEEEKIDAKGAAANLLQDLETQLDDEHHEDARELIVDPDGLETIMERWLPVKDAPEGPALLAALCADWNAKQSIVSYFEDRSRIVGLRFDVAHKDCVDYARREAAEAALRAEEIAGLWREPYRGDRDDLIRTLDGMDIHLSRDHGRSGWTVWKDGRKERFPTFETAVEYSGTPGAKP